MCSTNEGDGLTASVQKRPETTGGVGSTVCDMAQDTYGWRGYRNFWKLFGFAILAAAIAVGVVVAVPGLRITEAAGSASVAVALIVAFGLWVRVRRVAAPCGSVRAFEGNGCCRPGAGVLRGGGDHPGQPGRLPTVASRPGALVRCLCPGAECLRGAARAVDPGPWLARYGICRVGGDLAGAAQLFGVMYRPPRLDPRHVSDDVQLRRFGSP